LDDIRRPLERFGRILATAALLFLLAFAAGVVFVLTSPYADGASRQVDFAAFWSAARLALAGDAIAAFDQEALRQVQELPASAEKGELVWLYPPGVQLALAPFGLLPFWAAWLIFGVTSLAAFASALWRPARPVPMGHSLLLGAPIVVITLQLGQLLLFWASALIGALRAIALGRAAAAGFMIGLLSLKPQLGILVPVALVAARRWDVIAWAGLGVAAVHGLPTLVVGTEYWAAFLTRVEQVNVALEKDLFQHQLMVTPYALARAVGLTHQPAMGLQAVVSLALAFTVYRLWRRAAPQEALGRAGGVLSAAIPIATPYAYYYEMVFGVPAAILLVRGGYGATAIDRLLLGIAVIGPAVLWLHTPLSPYFAPLLLAFALRGALAGRPRPIAAANRDLPGKGRGVAG
jgi:hypothetical protein